MKLMTVIGARPQFIKAAIFSNIFRNKYQEVIVHTGQHYDDNMSKKFFMELNLPIPDYNLGIGSGKHGVQTGRMLEKIEKILLMEKPNGVIVYGDTNSTLAGALSASKLNIPVFHIEAGLRSYNMSMPEEQNRVLTDHLSTLLLCPTNTAVNNLAKEGISRGVYNTGDIMYDSVLQNIAISEKKYNNGIWLTNLKDENKINISLKEKQYYLSTIHRAENADNANKLRVIFDAFAKLDKPVLLPIHPRTQKNLTNMRIAINNAIIIKPVGYLLMLYLVAKSYMVITDSGGLQKEAYFLKTPCTTIRDQTEWEETLFAGWNKLTPVNVDSIIKCIHRSIIDTEIEQPMVFGDGKAVYKIIASIEKYFGYKCN